MLPSDREILKVLPQVPQALHMPALLKMLGMHAEDQPTLRARLRALVTEGLVQRVEREGYGRPQDVAIAVGVLRMTPRGFGLVDVEGGDGAVYISGRDVGEAMHRDRVEIEVRPGAKGRSAGVVTKVLERGTSTFVGTYRAGKRFRVIHPQDPRMPEHVTVEAGGDGEAKDGDLVAAEFVGFPVRAGAERTVPVARVLRVFDGESEASEAIEVATYDLGLRIDFPASVKRAAAEAPTTLSKAELARRRDLRTLPLLTIDPESARDFDDAVHCETTPEGWRLTVAIADVSHYVPRGESIDAEALLRGTSVYLPDRVMPMLPHRLSSDLCSLRPDEDRAVMVAQIDIDHEGRRTGVEVFEAVMRSHARFTYDRAADMLGVRSADTIRQADDDPTMEALRPQLEALLAVTRAMRADRRKRGFLDLDLGEPRIFFDEEGEVQDVRSAERHEAHMMVEDAMLAANEAIADFMVRHELPTLFRVHGKPPSDRLERFKSQVAQLDVRLDGAGNSVAELTAFVRGLSRHPQRNLIALLLLRSMAKATYDAELSPHFGLGAPRYLHFTSPIRRYPDLVVHRVLKAHLNGGVPDQEAGEMGFAALGEHCSRRERAAVDAERTVLDLCKALFMADQLGAFLEGTVVSVTSLGLFVQIDGHAVEGLLPMRAFADDFYELEAAASLLVGQRTGASFGLGDRLRIQVDEVNIRRRQITFSLVKRLETTRSQRPNQRRRGVAHKVISRQGASHRPGSKSQHKSRRGGRRH